MDVYIKHHISSLYDLLTSKDWSTMQEFRTIVASPVGLHARPASLFSRSAKESGCAVRLAKVTDGAISEFVDGSSILRVMTLGVKCGDEIVVQVEGENEVATADALRTLAESAAH
ncbi:MAG: HPr family phosphocarrier protein [Candidatus Nanopelagicaceae bacterium]|nr:HPr family phosphocarrier protein [Candidatus Nanopelagicaceae bacterium]